MMNSAMERLRQGAFQRNRPPARDSESRMRRTSSWRSQISAARPAQCARKYRSICRNGMVCTLTLAPRKRIQASQRSAFSRRERLQNLCNRPISHLQELLRPQALEECDGFPRAGFTIDAVACREVVNEVSDLFRMFDCFPDAAGDIGDTIIEPLRDADHHKFMARLSTNHVGLDLNDGVEVIHLQ